MSKPRAIGVLLMVAGVSAYGTAPDWLALLMGLLGLATTLFADLRYLRLAIARRHFSFLVDRAILLTALAPQIPPPPWTLTPTSPKRCPEAGRVYGAWSL